MSASVARLLASSHAPANISLKLTGRWTAQFFSNLLAASRLALRSARKEVDSS